VSDEQWSRELAGNGRDVGCLYRHRVRQGDRLVGGVDPPLDAHDAKLFREQLRDGGPR